MCTESTTYSDSCDNYSAPACICICTLRRQALQLSWVNVCEPTRVCAEDSVTWGSRRGYPCTGTAIVCTALGLWYTSYLGLAVVWMLALTVDHTTSYGLEHMGAIPNNLIEVFVSSIVC